MEKRDTIHSIPPVLPCGCRSVVGNNNKSASRLSDGSRICKLHRKRYVLTFLEEALPVQGEGTTSVTNGPGVPHVER
jgi:hypothetical protein